MSDCFSLAFFPLERIKLQQNGKAGNGLAICLQYRAWYIRLSLDLVYMATYPSGMKSVSTHEAKTYLSRLLAEVETGEEYVICRGKVPAAKLVPVSRKPARRRPKVGTVTSGPVRVTDDAFSPMTSSEFEDWGL